MCGPPQPLQVVVENAGGDHDTSYGSKTMCSHARSQESNAIKQLVCEFYDVYEYDWGRRNNSVWDHHHEGFPSLQDVRLAENNHTTYYGWFAWDYFTENTRYNCLPRDGTLNEKRSAWLTILKAVSDASCQLPELTEAQNAACNTDLNSLACITARAAVLQ